MNENQTTPQPEKGLDDKRKAALLRYIGVMFAVAFLFVLISLGGKLRSSEAVISQLNESSTSALQNAEQLQDHNRQLETDNAYLEGRIEELEKQLTELEQELADAETALDEQSALLEELQAAAKEQTGESQQIYRAYELLLQAAEDPSVLPILEDYIGYFDSFGLKFYENLTKEGE